MRRRLGLVDLGLACRTARSSAAAPGTSNALSQAAITGPVSLATSVVTNTTRACARTAAGTAFSASPMSAIVVGQTSGQWV